MHDGEGLRGQRNWLPRYSVRSALFGRSGLVLSLQESWLEDLPRSKRGSHPLWRINDEPRPSKAVRADLRKKGALLPQTLWKGHGSHLQNAAVPDESDQVRRV